MMPQNGETILRDIAEIYDAYAPTYDLAYRQMIHRVEDEIIAGLVQDLYEPGMSVLDVGCGTGNMINAGMFEPDDYTGLDISPQMIRRAQYKFPAHTFRQHDVTAGLAGSWDLITAVFGIINYISIEQWVKIISQNLHPEANWLAVMYSDCYKPGYINGEAFSYSLRDVESALVGVGMPYEVYGLSFPFLGDEDASFGQMLEQQWTLSQCSTSNCRYWVLVG
jgi:predicted TPR repeat methyltransferase